LTVREQLRLAVQGSITSDRGEPLEGVEVKPVGRVSEPFYSDQAGFYQVQLPVSGQRQVYTLWFSKEGYTRGDVTLYRREITGSAGVLRDVQLKRVESVADVTGRLIGRDGAAVPAENIYLVGENRYQGVSTESGDFYIPDVEAETSYKLWVRPRAAYKDYSETVRVSASGLRTDVVLEPLDYGSLSGEMKDAQGNPLPYFSMWLRSRSAVGQKALLVSSDESGYYSAEGVPAGPVTFSTLSNPRLTVGPYQLAAGAVEELDLVLDVGGYEIRGRVQDSEGNPVPAAQVALDWSSRSGSVRAASKRSIWGDANGYFRFTDVGSGWYLVRAFAFGYKSAQVEHKADRGGELLVQLRPAKTDP
jgi:hypothetical protein